MSLRGFEKSEVIHNIYSFFKNWIATPHAVRLTASARNDNFNYTYALKNNFASLNNNVAVAHCVNNSEKSAQGVTTPCYKNWIATPSARNDNFNYTYALKNNFIIPNLVKTILTLDSFTRKIKSPCLTIKKFYSKGVCKMKHTKNILKSLLITVMALSLLAVSCKKDEGGSKPTDPITPKDSATLLTEMLKRLGPLGSDTSNPDVDFSKMTEPASGTANIEGANKKYATVKAALEGVLTTANFQKEQIGLTANATIPTQPSGAEALSVELTFKANANYTFDDSIIKGTAYTYEEASKTAKLTLKITPAQAWE